jgi:ferritin-like metal-binding protein YciE
MAVPKSAHDILITELKEIYSAERQMSRLVPKLLKRIPIDTLKQKLEQRRDQSGVIIEGLDEIFDELEVTKSRPKNVAAEGLVEDINQHIEEIEDLRFLAPVLLASVQKIEHYCIAAWGTARSLGQMLGEERVVQLMDRALEEGKRYDQELTDLAEKEVNPTMETEPAE